MPRAGAIRSQTGTEKTGFKSADWPQEAAYLQAVLERGCGREGLQCVGMKALGQQRLGSLEREDLQISA